MDQMIRLDFNGKRDELKNLIDALDLTEKEIRAAIASALNKTMRSVRYQIIKDVGQKTKAPQKVIRQRVNDRKASTARTSTSLSMYVAAIPLTVFGFRDGKRGISSKAGRFKKAFFRDKVKSQRGRARDKVLERQTGSSRYPLFERRVSIIDEAIASFEINEAKVFELFHERLLHELRWRGGLLG